MAHILDAKYEQADLIQVSKCNKKLSPKDQQKLLNLLLKYESLFDGQLGHWKDANYDIKLKEGATPFHSKPYPIPKAHEQTLKKEIQRLVNIGVLKKVNRSEWAAPTFIIPKKNQTVRVITDFRELNNASNANHSPNQKYKIYC